MLEKEICSNICEGRTFWTKKKKKIRAQLTSHVLYFGNLFLVHESLGYIADEKDFFFFYRELSDTTFSLEYFWLTWPKGKFAWLSADKQIFGIALHLAMLVSKQCDLEAI